LESPNGDGKWLIEEPTVVLTNTDIVYYWYYLVIDDHGYQFIEKYVNFCIKSSISTSILKCFNIIFVSAWSPGGPLTTTPTPGSTTEPIPDIISVSESSEGT
jgi:hypothetical protein